MLICSIVFRLLGGSLYLPPVVTRDTRSIQPSPYLVPGSAPVCSAKRALPRTPAECQSSQSHLVLPLAIQSVSEESEAEKSRLRRVCRKANRRCARLRPCFVGLTISGGAHAEPPIQPLSGVFACLSLARTWVPPSLWLPAVTATPARSCGASQTPKRQPERLSSGYL